MYGEIDRYDDNTDIQRHNYEFRESHVIQDHINEISNRYENYDNPYNESQEINSMNDLERELYEIKQRIGHINHNLAKGLN